MWKIDSSWEASVEHRDLSSVLCEDLEGFDGRVGAGLRREVIHVFLQLIHIDVQQKLNTTVIFQLKNKFKKRMRLQSDVFRFYVGWSTN